MGFSVLTFWANSLYLKLYLVLTTCTCAERRSGHSNWSSGVVICHCYSWLENESHNCSLLSNSRPLQLKIASRTENWNTFVNSQRLHEQTLLPKFMWWSKFYSGITDLSGCSQIELNCINEHDRSESLKFIDGWRLLSWSSSWTLTVWGRNGMVNKMRGIYRVIYSHYFIIFRETNFPESRINVSSWENAGPVIFSTLWKLPVSTKEN